MELEELKKSWNVLDEHLKDKEFIKEEELSKLLGHTGKGILPGFPHFAGISSLPATSSGPE